eukprot:27429-Eustigmatos_ZCMA.PRE.1
MSSISASTSMITSFITIPLPLCRYVSSQASAVHPSVSEHDHNTFNSSITSNAPTSAHHHHPNHQSSAVASYSYDHATWSPAPSTL